MDPMTGLMTNAAAPAGDPATVDVNWTLFQSVYSAVDLPVVNAVNGVLDALAAYLNPMMIAMLTAYMMLAGLRLALAPNGAPMQTMMMDVVRGALVVTLVGNAGNFNHWIGTLFLTTIPNEIGQAVNGSFGAGGTPVNGGAQFDAVWNAAYKAGLVVYNNLPSVLLKGIALTFCVFVFWFLAIASVAIGFLMFLASNVLMALLVAVGPIFIACALWPASRAFFSGWVASCVSTLTAQILIVALMSLMLTVETAQLHQITASPINANEVGQIGSLIGVAALLGICSLLAKQIPAVAVGIAGGAYHNLNSYANAIGAAGAAGSKLISMARGPSAGGGSGSGGTTGVARPSAPTSFVGRSMSGS
jgi:type IV secretion system protein VirB6